MSEVLDFLHIFSCKIFFSERDLISSMSKSSLLWGGRWRTGERDKMRHVFTIKGTDTRNWTLTSILKKNKLNMGFYFIFVFFCFFFVFLQDWWHNPRLTTIRFRGAVDHTGNAKKTFCCFICYSNHFYFHFLLPIDVSITKSWQNNNQDDTFAREGDGELIASHKIQENRWLHSEDNQQFPSSFSLVFNRGLQNDFFF